MAFIAIPTLAGQAAIAAAIDPVSPIPLVLSELVVGDGNGSPVAPVETQTQLVHQTAVVPIATTSRDGNKLTIDAIIDETIGGFTIREAGILDENGVLMFVASLPETEKIADSPSTQDILTIGLIVIVSDTAAVTISVEGITYATHDYVNSAISALRTNIVTPLRPYHIAVKSMAIATPPASPTPGDTYIVAADATGSWAGQTGKLTQYIGSQNWVFVAVPNGQLVGNEATGLLHQKIAGTWVAVLPANAAGWLQNDGTGVKTWSDPFNIKGLTSRNIAATDAIPFHATAIDAKRKTTASDLASLVLVSDYLHSEMFFMGELLMAKAAITPVTGSGSYTVPADKYAIINVILQGEATTVQAKLKINGTLVALDGTATSDEDHPVVLNGITLNAGSVATLQVTGSGDGARALLTGFEYDA